MGEHLDDEHRRRHHDAHERAAACHELAVVTHEKAASLFEEHGRPDLAAPERDLASEQSAKAEAEHTEADRL